LQHFLQLRQFSWATRKAFAGRMLCRSAVMDFSNLWKRKHCYSFTHAFTQYKTTCFTVFSSRCLAASLAKDVWGQQSHAEKHVNYRNLKRTFKDSLPCYCYATKSNSITMRSQVRQLEYADEGVDMSGLQAHHCITPEQWSWLLCNVTVSVILVNKVPLQEVNQLIGIKMLSSDFLKRFGSGSQFPEANARFLPCGRPWK